MEIVYSKRNSNKRWNGAGKVSSQDGQQILLSMVVSMLDVTMLCTFGQKY